MTLIHNILGATAYRKASYDPLIPQANGSVHFTRFNCLGSEQTLMNCTYYYNTYTHHRNDAGIKCCEYTQCGWDQLRHIIL